MTTYESLSAFELRQARAVLQALRANVGEYAGEILAQELKYDDDVEVVGAVWAAIRPAEEAASAAARAVIDRHLEELDRLIAESPTD